MGRRAHEVDEDDGKESQGFWKFQLFRAFSVTFSRDLEPINFPMDRVRFRNQTRNQMENAEECYLKSTQRIHPPTLTSTHPSAPSVSGGIWSRNPDELNWSN